MKKTFANVRLKTQKVDRTGGERYLSRRDSGHKRKNEKERGGE